MSSERDWLKSLADQENWGAMDALKEWDALEAENERLREAAKNYRIAVHVWALMECAESAAPQMTEASAKLTEALSGEGKEDG